LALAHAATSHAQDCGFVPTGASGSNVRYGGDIRSSGDVFGRPAISSQSFTFLSEGHYNLGAEAALAIDADAFGGTASAGGFVTIDPIYTGGGAATASGVWRDCLTISGHAGTGQLRIPIQLDGARTVSWSIGGAYVPPQGSQPIGVARAYVSCTAFTVGVPGPETCPDFSFQWLDSGAIDEIVTLIAPFTFGSPLDFRIDPTLSVGLGYSSPTGQTGLLTGNAALELTGTLLAASVTDAIGTPLAGVTIDAESGFDYLTAPEPGAALATLLALASLAAVRGSRTIRSA
jgi:hypothetical protein